MVSLTHGRTHAAAAVLSWARLHGEDRPRLARALLLLARPRRGRLPVPGVRPGGRRRRPSLQPGPERGVARAQVAGEGPGPGGHGRALPVARRARDRLRLPAPHPLQRRGAAARAQPRADARPARLRPPRRAGHEDPALGGRACASATAASARGRWTSATSASASASWPSAAGSWTRASTACTSTWSRCPTATSSSWPCCARCGPPSAAGSCPSPRRGPGPSPCPSRPTSSGRPITTARVAAEADQLVVMAYDTALPTPSLYRRYLSYAARSIDAEPRALRPRPRAHRDPHLRRHRPHAPRRRREPGERAHGPGGGLRGVGGGGTFEGVALYAEWTTDDAEWATYERVWRNAGR